jgi:predicted SAM-dependent methyltransferase
VNELLAGRLMEEWANQALPRSKERENTAMIDFKNKQPNQRMLELGGGESWHPLSDVRVDARPTPGTSFTHDLETFPWPMQDGEFDFVYAHFLLEHISWPLLSQFLSEVARVMKPGGKCIFCVPNTEAQIQWIKDHPQGWDGKDPFIAFSEVIFGSQSYKENVHKSYWSPLLAVQIFQSMGFIKIRTRPYGERETDLCIEAEKSHTPFTTNLLGSNVQQVVANTMEEKAITRNEVRELRDTNTNFAVTMNPIGDQPAGQVVVLKPTTGEFAPPESPKPTLTREEMFDKAYFNGGGKVGGYSREGYWDYPIHHVTASHILARKPSSALELGCARGYIMKRLQDAGVPKVHGLEISKHCYLTRVAKGVHLCDLCSTWPLVQDSSYDLCYSVATLEHIPEEDLPLLIQQMAKYCKRGLHGVDFGENDDNFDKTHVTLRNRQWWLDVFNRYAPNWPVQIVDKEELERGAISPEVQFGDGKVKLNIGSFSTMHHHGWQNLDALDVSAFAQQHGYLFTQCDVRNGLPYDTGSVDLIHCCHMLEHLTYDEGLRFLKECRRVLKPDSGCMRVIVPNAQLLMSMYVKGGVENLTLDDFDEINDGCASSKTDAGKVWALLHEGHSATYDAFTLDGAMQEAGFAAIAVPFRESNWPERGNQILHETLDMLPSLSLYVEGIPLTQ